MYFDHVQLSQAAIPSTSPMRHHCASIEIPRAHGFGIAFPLKVCTDDGAVRSVIRIWKLSKQLETAFKYISHV